MIIKVVGNFLLERLQASQMLNVVQTQAVVSKVIVQMGRILISVGKYEMSTFIPFQFMILSVV